MDPRTTYMVTYEDILEARDNLHPDIIRTPLQIWRFGSQVTDRVVQAKLENLQRTGSFKARGAWNKLRLMRPPHRDAGVICASAGNHAQGVALAAHLMETHATIVMPTNTPRIKVKQTRLYGTPEIILHGGSLREATEHAYTIQKERGMYFVHPFDDEAVIAGQGTVGLEIIEQWPELDTIVVPVGGGGLIAGIATAILSHHPDIRVIGVQAKDSDAAARSMEKGRIISLRGSRTMADGINVGTIGESPFKILRKYNVPILRVTEEEIQATITDLCQTSKLVVEPAGAASAALVLFHTDELVTSRRIVCLLSGANINTSDFADILKAHPDVTPD